MDHCLGDPDSGVDMFNYLASLFICFDTCMAA